MTGHAAIATPAWPDRESINQALKSHPFPTPGELVGTPIPRLPQLELAPAPTDVRALMEHSKPADRNPEPTYQPLMIFITLGMPQESLLRLVEQAERSGAVLVLRGLRAQSMRETLKAVSELLGPRRIRLNLDPEAFRRYRVTETPSIVLRLTPDAMQCTAVEAPENGYLKIRGDVSLDYALDAMRRARPEASPLVAPLLVRLGKP